MGEKETLSRLAAEAGRQLHDVAKSVIHDPAPWSTRKVGVTIGGRPDGTMDPGREMNAVELVRNAVNDARRIVDEFERSVIQLESKLAEVTARFETEQEARLELERQIRQICELVKP